MTEKSNAPEAAAEDFTVALASEPDGETIVLTGEERAKKWVAESLARYDPSNRQYSAFLLDSVTTGAISADELDTLAENAQNNLKNLLTINAAVRKEINLDDIIGKVYECVDTNINTDCRFSYRRLDGKKVSAKKLAKAKDTVANFNEQIHLPRLIRDAVSIAYAEGNYICCLRSKDGGWVVDYYPLGVAVISDYELGGLPVVLIDIRELEKALKKTMLKNRSGKALFFESVEKEIQANYPKEVYDAYKKRENYAVLDVRQAGVIRVGNLGRKYGVTPILRALKPTLMLRTFEAADSVGAKAKTKKIIHQVMRKETMGPAYDKKGLEDLAYAHQNFMAAWKQGTVVVTTPPTVERIQYIEPKADDVNVDKINLYRSKVVSALGVSFLNVDGRQTVSTASISLDQLLKTINKISEQLETILARWYALALEAEGLGPEYCPAVEIIDSEQMSFDMRQSLATLLFSTLSCSYETALGVLGIDVEDERERRKKENEEGYEAIFRPRGTAYTKSAEPDAGGRPAATDPPDPDKQEEDRVRNAGK